MKLEGETRRRVLSLLILVAAVLAVVVIMNIQANSERTATETRLTLQAERTAAWLTAMPTHQP